jgi:hypothetical protein
MPAPPPSGPSLLRTTPKGINPVTRLSEPPNPNHTADPDDHLGTQPAGRRCALPLPEARPPGRRGAPAIPFQIRFDATPPFARDVDVAGPHDLIRRNASATLKAAHPPISLDIVAAPNKALQDTALAPPRVARVAVRDIRRAARRQITTQIPAIT